MSYYTCSFYFISVLKKVKAAEREKIVSMQKTISIFGMKLIKIHVCYNDTNKSSTDQQYIVYN